MPKSWTDGAPSPVVMQEQSHLKDPLSYVIKRRLLGTPLNRHTLGLSDLTSEMLLEFSPQIAFHHRLMVENKFLSL